MLLSSPILKELAVNVRIVDRVVIIAFGGMNSADSTPDHWDSHLF